jgi:hypothetical protein
LVSAHGRVASSSALEPRGSNPISAGSVAISGPRGSSDPALQAGDARPRRCGGRAANGANPRHRLAAGSLYGEAKWRARRRRVFRAAAAVGREEGIIVGFRSRPLQFVPVSRRVLAGALLLGLLAGCEVFKNNEEATAIVSGRALGMPVGEFFDRYGRPEQRAEHPDGSLEFVWVSATKQPTGFAGVDDHVCSLRLSADKRGHINGVEVMYDGQGKTRQSRCSEIFAAEQL